MLRPTDDDVAASASGTGRHSRIKAAGQALELICQAIGPNAALVLLWDQFERVAARLEEDRGQVRWVLGYYRILALHGG